MSVFVKIVTRISPSALPDSVLCGWMGESIRDVHDSRKGTRNYTALKFLLLLFKLPTNIPRDRDGYQIKDSEIDLKENEMAVLLR